MSGITNGATATAPTVDRDALTAALSGLLAASLRDKPIERSIYAVDQLRGRIYQLLRNAAIHPLGRFDRIVRDAMQADPRAVFCAADDVNDAAFNELYRSA